jgi:uncharacterized protein YegP (UPF0339 family)
MRHAKPTRPRPDGFEVYRDRAGGWRWRLIRAGRIVADSGECYTRRADGLRASRNVRAWLGEMWTAPGGIIPIRIDGVEW